jgi:hypothetical protein
VRKRAKWIVGIGVLLLATGCAAGAGRAADLPHPRPLAPPHSPDGLTVARETETPFEKRVNIALWRAAPLGSWAFLTLVLAF